jgi:nucleotide-binding universal stress UspA family protein
VSILALAHAVATHAEPRVPTHSECVFERPAQVLTGAAETARLLVVGMDGGSGLDDVRVRSLALDVCAAASCPVVVVRGPAGPLSPDGLVVLGVDDVGRDATAITAAFTEADGPATRLVVLHALLGPASGRMAAEGKITTALAPWGPRHAGVPVEVRVVHGAPAGRLLEAAVPARLLVVGTHARGPAAQRVLGSTSRAVVRRSACPVMVVPRDARVSPAPRTQRPPSGARCPPRPRRGLAR